jgi:hypothetical protein
MDGLIKYPLLSLGVHVDAFDQESPSVDTPTKKVIVTIDLEGNRFVYALKKCLNIFT